MVQMETTSPQRGFCVWPSVSNHSLVAQADTITGQSNQASKASSTVHMGWETGLSLSHLFCSGASNLEPTGQTETRNRNPARS